MILSNVERFLLLKVQRFLNKFAVDSFLYSPNSIQLRAILGLAISRSRGLVDVDVAFDVQSYWMIANTGLIGTK